MASVESTAPPALRLKRLPANVGIARVQIAIGLGPRPVTAPPDQRGDLLWLVVDGSGLLAFPPQTRRSRGQRGPASPTFTAGGRAGPRGALAASGARNRAFRTVDCPWNGQEGTWGSARCSPLLLNRADGRSLLLVPPRASGAICALLDIRALWSRGRACRRRTGGDRPAQGAGAGCQGRSLFSAVRGGDGTAALKPSPARRLGALRFPWG